MSATDDARIPPAVHGTRSLVLSALVGAAIGVGVGLLAIPAREPLFEAHVAWRSDPPALREWPRAARPGETAVTDLGPAGSELVVRGPRAPRVRELAAAFVAQHAARTHALLEARDGLMLRWSAPVALPAGGPAAESPQARAVALLLARARALRDEVAALPAPWQAGPGAPAPVPPGPLAELEVRTALAAEAGEPGPLERALLEEAYAADEWFAAGVPSRLDPVAGRGAAWGAWQVARADSLEGIADRSLAGLPPAARDSLAYSTALALRELSSRLPQPYRGLLRSVGPQETPEARPIARTWLLWLGGGGLLGMLAGLLGAGAGLALRRAPNPDRLLFLPRRDPGSREAWLHVVAGPSAAAVARASLELAAHSLAHGERVLLVDGGPRLRLHERFGREARWGLMECLLADMPVLGLVQYGGRPGFYLLAHGNATRGEGWAALGQRLDDARQHFGRIVLALDPTAPHALGAALAGRALEGWWAEDRSRLSRVAVELSDRIGIPFSGMDLSGVSEVSLEELSGRVKALSLLVPAPAAPGVAVRIEPVLEASVEIPAEPIVLDCDLQVRQRLRFLAWMRRVQAERRRVEAGTIS